MSLSSRSTCDRGANSACSHLFVLWPNRDGKKRAGKDINLPVWLTHLSSTHICRASLEEVWAARFWEVPREAPSSALSELFPSSACPLPVLWRRGHSRPERELTQFLLLTGLSSSCNAAQAITQTLSLRLGIGHSHFRTETISRFSFFILTSPPRGCCAAGVKLYSEVFQKEEKVF